MENRVLADRRKQPTPLLSRYTFFGRRRTVRRKSDQLKGYYIERYSAGILPFVVLLVGLNVLDALFTMMILETSGEELNPVVQSVIMLLGDKFWIWKFMVVSTSAVLLCLHSHFRMVKAALAGVCILYAGVLVYEMALLSY
jgi:hypothetical protein